MASSKTNEGADNMDASINPTVNTTSDESTYSDSTLHSFVDYNPPLEAKILPPAKYKLWLIVFALVYFASWVAMEAEFLEFLRFEGWLSPEASLFLMLSIIVFVLVYSTMDLVITCLTFKTKSGNMYGVGAWLKQPKAQWMYSHENIVFECLARVIHIFEEGFSMFDSPPPGMAAKETPHQFECDNRKCHRTLKIEHRIKPDRVADYQKWVLRIGEAVKQQNRLLCTESTTIKSEWDEENDVPLPTTAASSRVDKTKTPPQLHVIHCKFANIDYLNDWMLSPRRKALMKALEPMLLEPDVVQIQSNRSLPDAFSDLLTRQGKAVPKSPPKKWKVWWLTVVALFITQQWSASFLQYYFARWRLSEADHRLERLVSVIISTFLNSYVMTPLFLFLFDHWLQQSDVGTKNTRQPWKTFDEGLQSIWPKIALTFAFYGGCIIVILVEK